LATRHVWRYIRRRHAISGDTSVFKRSIFTRAGQGLSHIMGRLFKPSVIVGDTSVFQSPEHATSGVQPGSLSDDTPCLAIHPSLSVPQCRQGGQPSYFFVLWRHAMSGDTSADDTPYLAIHPSLCVRFSLVPVRVKPHIMGRLQTSPLSGSSPISWVAFHTPLRGPYICYPSGPFA
jgi:hypothetical protein